MRSSWEFRASDCQCRSCNSPGFYPSILRHSGIWGAEDEAVLNTVHRKKIKTIPPVNSSVLFRFASIFSHFIYWGVGDVRKQVEGNSTQEGSKIPTWLTVSLVYKLYENTEVTDCVSSLWTLIDTCRKVSLQVSFFRWRHFSLVASHVPVHGKKQQHQESNIGILMQVYFCPMPKLSTIWFNVTSLTPSQHTILLLYPFRCLSLETVILYQNSIFIEKKVFQSDIQDWAT
jgi:hypothetical protein